MRRAWRRHRQYLGARFALREALYGRAWPADLAEDIQEWIAADIVSLMSDEYRPTITSLPKQLAPGESHVFTYFVEGSGLFEPKTEGLGLDSRRVARGTRAQVTFAHDKKRASRGYKGRSARATKRAFKRQFGRRRF